MGKKKKAIVVGGSIAGVSCAHALTAARWEVVVLEKSSPGQSSGSPTGAGLGLDPLSCKIINSWLRDGDRNDGYAPLDKVTLPLSIDQNQATDVEKKKSVTLTRDEEFNFKAAHWGDLHALLLGSLPPQVSFLWGHQLHSFHISDDKSSVTVNAKITANGENVQIVGDLLVAADGCMSTIRRTFLPQHKLRYAGYCAWRGVFDCKGDEDSEIVQGMRRAYPDLGRCLYFDLGWQTHSVFYEVPNKRVNWLWYINQCEPQMKGSSVTMKATDDLIKKMKEDAETTWLPEVVQLIKSTPNPFINIIYDSDPLDQLFWDNVVLVGDAAHPSTPHCLRSTNMSILDAAVLGKCLEKERDLRSALNEYQSIRLPVVASQVLHARRLGRIKQGLSLPDRHPLDHKKVNPKDCFELQQKNVPFFSHIPRILTE